MRQYAVLVLLTCLAGAALAAPQDWLPPDFERASVGMLVPRLTALGAAGPGADNAEAAALASARAVPERVDGWGEAGALKRAPALRGVGLPKAPQRHLEAMARYFTCIAVYEVMSSRNGFAAEPAAARLSAAKASFGLTVVTVFLRHHYQRETGLADETIEAFLTGKSMEPVLERLQADAGLLAASYAECRPVVAALVD